MKKLLAIALALGMVMSLAGCGGTTQPKTTEQKPKEVVTETEKEQATKPSENVERPYYVRSADEVTGTITVYTTIGETEQDALKSLWNKYYPECKIEIQSDSVGTLATRIRSDESCDADVVIGGMFAAD